MTDAQDLILDKLVGSKIGVNWPDGPLAIAAQVLDDTEPLRFVRTKPLRGVKAEIAKRLGYPMLLCEAIQGAVFGLKDEEDRRSFGMLVFRTVIVPGNPTRLTDRQQNRIAMDTALSVHSRMCSPNCPVVIAYQQAMDRPDSAIRQCLRTSIPLCSLPPASAGSNDWLRSELGGILWRGLIALAHGERSRGWASACESARLVASVRGVGEAAALIADLARRCGLAAEVL